MLDETPIDATPAAPSTKIHTIPMEFYGGKNPAPADIPTSAAVPAAQPILTQPKLPPKPVMPVGMVIPTASANKKKVPLIIGISVIIVLGGGFGAWYVFGRQGPVALPEPAPVAVATPPAPEPEPVAPAAVPEPPVETPIPVPPPAPPAIIPPHAFKDTADSDIDGLTDIEEELWTTDPTKTDSDADTYSDQMELQNLYNPAAVAPEKLAESKLINTYFNAEAGYTIFYPAAWVARALDETTKKEVLFSAISGEFVEVQVLAYPKGETFPDWFARMFPDERLASYTPFVNRFKIAGVMSPDKTVAFITDGTNVFLLRYDGGTRTEINYRLTFKTMVQSFKPGTVVMPIDLTTAAPVSTVAPTPVVVPAVPEAPPTSSTEVTDSPTTVIQ